MKKKADASLMVIGWTMVDWQNVPRSIIPEWRGPLESDIMRTKRQCVAMWNSHSQWRMKFDEWRKRGGRCVRVYIKKEDLK